MKSKLCNDNNLYKITVKEYMTRPSTASFDFMSNFNDNIPMPESTMLGRKILESDKMFLFDLRNNFGTKSWKGWIPKSAILSQSVEGTISPTKKDKTVDVILNVTPNGTSKGNVCYVVRMTLQNKGKLRTHELLEIYNYIPTTKYINETEFQFELSMLAELVEFCDKRGLTRQVINIDKVDYRKPYLISKSRVKPRYELSEIRKHTPVLKEKPKPHQIEAFEYAMERDSVLIADEMGLGKSFEALSVAIGKKLMFGYKHCLIICGVNSIKLNWMAEIHKFTNEDGMVLSKSVKKREDALKNITKLPYFIIVNIESFRNKDFSETVRVLCEKQYINMAIFDEIHKCVNHETQQAQGLLNMGITCKIALTGTPIINNPMDSFFIFSWLGFNYNFFGYKNFYTYVCDMYKGRQYKNLDVLTENYNRIMIRRKKADVLDLPEKIYIDELLEMSSEQEKLYKDVVAGIYAESDLDDDDIAFGDKSFCELARIVSQRLATSHPKLIDETSKAPSVKLDRLHDIVGTLDGEKVVIFSNWKKSLDIIQASFSTPVLRIDGSVPVAARQEIAEKFQNDPSEKILIGTIKAMGTGITLTAASNVVFFDEPWTNANKEQAIDRCHRIGTKKSVNVITLMCVDTIDSMVHDVVLGKKSLSDLIIDFKRARKGA